MKSIAIKIKDYANRIGNLEVESALPATGYDTLMPIKRPGRSQEKAHSKDYTFSKDLAFKPGDKVDVYNNGRWETIVWPKSKS